jgi:hypothetical protein
MFATEAVSAWELRIKATDWPTYRTLFAMHEAAWQVVIVDNGLEQRTVVKQKVNGMDCGQQTCQFHVVF